MSPGGKVVAVPALSGMPREQAALPLVLPHALRYIGLCFLVPGLPAQVLPEAFSLPPAYGDLPTTPPMPWARPF